MGSQKNYDNFNAFKNFIDLFPLSNWTEIYLGIELNKKKKRL